MLPVRSIASLALATAALALAAPAIAAEPPVRVLKLADAVALAVAQNPELRSQVLEADVAQLDHLQAGHRYGLVMTAGPDVKRSIRPTSQTFLTGGVSRLEEWTQDYRMALKQDLVTGGDVGLSVGTNVFDTNSTRVDVNPAYTPGLTLDFRQPLLREWWTGGRQVEIARIGADQARSRARAQLMKLVADVEVAYWDLVAARQEIGVREQALGLVRTLLEANRAKAKAGLMAKLDVLQAEASLAVREGGYLSAQRELARAEDGLRRLIVPRFTDAAWQAPIVPADRPGFAPRGVTFDEAWQLAGTQRPDLAQADLEAAQRRTQLDQAGNRLWPKLDLMGSAGTTNLAGQFERAVGDMSQLRNYDVRAGVSMEWPLGPNVQRDEYAKSRLRVDQADLDIQAARQRAFVEVREAVRNVAIGAKRVEATALAKRLADAKLDAEQAKLKAGLSTNFQVLQFQDDFQEASLGEVRALVEYMQALTRLELAQGTLLAVRGFETAGR